MKKTLFQACALFLASCCGPSLASGEECDTVARVVAYEGSVVYRSIAKGEWRNLTSDQSICGGTLLKTSSTGNATVLLADHTLIRLAPNSTLTIPASKGEDGILGFLKAGTAHFISRVTRRFSVATPFVNAGIEGTEFLVSVSEEEARVLVYEGRVRAENSFGAVVIEGGELAVARRDEAPVLETLIRPLDGVEWAIYYPPLALATTDAIPEEVVEALKERNYVKALEGLTGDDAPSSLYRGAIHLYLGAPMEAEKYPTKIPSSSPLYKEALAYRSVIALAQNDLSRARELATQGYALGSTPTTALALSYVLQAEGHLKEGIKILEEAPHTSLILTRLAELHLATGDREQALKIARRAQEGDRTPEGSRILGFIYLSREEIDKAKRYFLKARSITPQDPLVHLGIGLSLIEEGELPEGRQEIETAVSLDPSRSLLRSYLARAYFEEGRGKRAETQFTLAKRLDDRDPTSYLYHAILQVTRNQPVSALAEVISSIERNDARFPYRSRDLLERDSATRRANLARVYTILGFDRPGLAEAWRATTIDPTSPSSHQFLADAYVGESRQAIARVSEQLQAQLLQPLPSRPLPLQGTESSLAIQQGGGPMEAAWNEYTRVFQKEGFSAVGGVRLGSQRSRQEDVSAMYLSGTTSINGGVYHEETEGFRRNNSLDRDSYALGLHALTSNSTSLLAEYRGSTSKEGDRALRFSRDEVEESFKREIDEDMFRVGLRHALSSEATLLGVTTYQRRRENTTLLDTFNPAEDKSANVEGQGYFTFGKLKVVAGGSGARVESDTSSLFATSSNTHHYYNAHSYSYYSLSPNLTLIGGLAFDDFETLLSSTRWSDRSLSPKLGLVYSITPSTLLRAAVFQSFKRELVHNQTLEPTHIAGFNQFFDDLNGTRSRRLGIALDKRFREKLFTGVSLGYREARPLFEEIDFSTFEATPRLDEWREKEAVGYINWALSPEIALSLTHRWEYDDREKYGFLHVTEENFSHLETHLSTLRASHYLPNGLFFWNEWHRYDQNVRYFTLASREEARGESNGVIADVGLGYRLPNRLGLTSLEVRNIGDRKIEYQERSGQAMTLSPERSLWWTLRFTF